MNFQMRNMWTRRAERRGSARARCSCVEGSRVATDVLAVSLTPFTAPDPSPACRELPCGAVCRLPSDRTTALGTQDQPPTTKVQISTSFTRTCVTRSVKVFSLHCASPHSIGMLDAQAAEASRRRAHKKLPALELPELVLCELCATRYHYPCCAQL